MRNILLVLLMTSGFNGLAQDDSADIKFAPTLTDFGKPTGERVSEKIDNSGGKIISSDGRMELFIPADAVSKTTDISIQPVTNTLSPGRANAYQLEPSGMTFQKPLQITLRYSRKEDPAGAALRGIAWQDGKGQWNRLDSSTVDTITRTVSGYINHFSTWVFFDYFQLEPSHARVKVGHLLQLQIICTYPGGLSDEFKSTIMRQMKFSTYADGVLHGNAVVGKVTPVMGNSDFRVLNYTAPATVPDNNPVDVSTEVSNVTFNGRTYSKLKLVSNILVYDKAFKITVIGYNRQQVSTCVVSSIDSSSCILELKGSRSRLGDIQNMNIVVTSKGCRCPVTEINKGNNSGPIEIEGATKIDVVPADPPKKPYPFITVYFMRTIGVMPGWHAPPCGHTNDVVTPPMALPAVPFLLAFEGKDEEYTVAKQGGDNGFEIKVAPVKDDN